MLTPEGTVKLVDLGVAKITDGSDSLKTTANSVFGTPAYISPEQALDSSKVDTRADIYSLGIVLFEMLCGQRPYNGNTPQEIIQQVLDHKPIPDIRTFNKQVSVKIATVIQMMCAKQAEDRIASPEKLIEAFTRLGYTLPDEPLAEFAAAPEQDPMPVELPPEGTADNTLTFETQDKEIQDFVAKLKHKRQQKRWIKIVLIALGILAVVIAIAIAI